MAPPRAPDVDPNDAEPAFGAPSDRADVTRALEAIFGRNVTSEVHRTDAEIAASQARLAALFEGKPQPAVAVVVTPPEPEAGQPRRAHRRRAAETPVEASALAALFSQPDPGAVVAGEVVVGSAAEPLPAAPDTLPEPGGAFSPTPRRRGLFTWSRGIRWSIAISVVLLAAVVVAAVVVAQSLAENSREAEALTAAVGRLESAEASATDPQVILDEAIAGYDDTVDAARASADRAAPALAAVAGMSDEVALAAASVALAALVAQLDAPPLKAPPEPYERGEVDMNDPDAIVAATQLADEHADRVATATQEARAAQALVVEKVDALTAAQVALGASLPATAVIIVAENPQAVQSLQDAVVAASVAVGTAQAAGASGDAEMLAYAAAVTALREDQARADAARRAEPVTPPVVSAEPVPVPVPSVPEPSPSEIVTPTPDPSGTP